MIRCFFTMVLLIQVCISSTSGQSYKSMLGDSSIWHIVYEYQGLFNSDNYFVNEDTVIDNKTYGFLNGFHFNKNVYLREDTALRRVFYRQKKGFKANEDVLLYDFNLNIGDSMLLFNPNTTLVDSVGYFLLDSISTVAILGGIHRKFYLSKSDGSDAAVWIEGIGSESLVNSTSGIGDLPENAQLSCFYKDGNHIYESELAEAFNDCEIKTVGIKDQSEDDVIIFPNPTSSFINIDAGSHFTGTLILRDVSGQILKSASITEKKSIDITDLNPGLYFVELNSDDFSKIVKLMKQ